MSIEFFSRLPLHGETQYLPGDPRNRGDWGPSDGTGAVSDFKVGDPFTPTSTTWARSPGPTRSTALAEC